MKTLIFVAVLLLVAILSMVFGMFSMFMDIAPQELRLALGTLLLWRIVPILAVFVLGILLWRVIEVYFHLPKEDKDEINKLACPAVDAGLYEAKKRKDWFGRIATYLRAYRKFARARQ